MLVLGEGWPYPSTDAVWSRFLTGLLSGKHDSRGNVMRWESSMFGVGSSNMSSRLGGIATRRNSGHGVWKGLRGMSMVVEALAAGIDMCGVSGA